MVARHCGSVVVRGRRTLKENLRRHKWCGGAGEREEKAWAADLSRLIITCFRSFKMKSLSREFCSLGTYGADMQKAASKHACAMISPKLC